MSSPWSNNQTLLRGQLRALREDAGLTQVQLAERLGKPQSYVSKVELGDRTLDFLEVREYCRACDHSFIDFVVELERHL